jgi:hypothetical protein
MKNKHLILIPALLLALSGCGSDNDSNTNDDDKNQDPQGKISLDLTDGPIDQAIRVVIEFTGVTITPANGDVMHFEFDEPRQIDVLSLQGGVTTPLLDNVDIPIGEYSSIQLNVNAGTNAEDSFIELASGGIHALHLPDENAELLQIAQGFTVSEDRSADITVDFDLRQSVFDDPAGGTVFTLRPTLRAVDTENSVSVIGTISSGLALNDLAAVGCTPAIYVWEGMDAASFDIGHTSGPVATSSVVTDGTTGDVGFSISFLPPGEYTIGLTCDAGLDTAEPGDQVNFIAQEWVTLANAENPVTIDGDPLTL